MNKLREQKTMMNEMADVVNKGVQTAARAITTASASSVSSGQVPAKRPLRMLGDTKSAVPPTKASRKAVTMMFDDDDSEDACWIPTAQLAAVAQEIRSAKTAARKFIDALDTVGQNIKAILASSA